LLLVLEGFIRGFPPGSTSGGEKEKMEMKNELLQGDSWTWFKDALSKKASSTQEGYFPRFIKFLEWSGMTTQELYEAHLKNTRDEDPRSKKLIPKLIRKYNDEIMSRGTGASVCKMTENALKLFFKANELTLEMNDYAVELTTDEIPNVTKEQIRTILDMTGSTRMKAIIHTAKDSGLRVSDVCNIKVEDIAPALDPIADFWTWELTQQKTKRKANPTIGGEALTWIGKWLHDRDKTGTESPYLFVNLKNVKPRTDKDGQNFNEARRGDKIKPSNVSVIFRQLRDKAGLKPTGISLHSLRKYHKTTLEFSGCPTSWINRMTGRKGTGTGGVYTKPNA